MPLNEELLTKNLEAIAKQRVEAQAQLARLDGAEQMCRHFLSELHKEEATKREEITQALAATDATQQANGEAAN